MKQRIKELAEQASLELFNDTAQYRLLGEFAEKFSELVVRECLSFIEPMPGSGDIDDLAVEAATKEIKDHFGI